MISNLKTLLKSVALIPVATVLFSGSAQAALIGDTVNGQLSASRFGTVLNENADVTDPGVEFTAFAGAILVDLRNDSFDIIINSFGSPQTGVDITTILSDLDFDFAGTPGFITGVTLASGNSSLIDNISFTNNSIAVDIPSLTFTSPSETFSFDIDAEPVPEPITLLGTGAALGFGILMKKKKAAKSV